jgi:hypothetical protein
MDVYERLRQSEQSRRLAWQVLQEIRQVLEILGDQRIPYEGEMKRFRAEGDFLLRALANLISQSRSQVHLLEHEPTQFSELVEQHDLPREIRKALHQMLRLCRGGGLDENQLRERLDKLKELRMLPEYRIPGALQYGLENLHGQWPVSQDSCRSDKLIDTRKAPGNRQTIGDDKRPVLIIFEEMEQPGIRTVIC